MCLDCAQFCKVEHEWRCPNHNVRGHGLSSLYVGYYFDEEDDVGLGCDNCQRA